LRACHVLLDQQHGHSRVDDKTNLPVHLVDDDRGEPEARLVDHDEPAAPHQTATDGEHAPFAPREGARTLAPAFEQPGEDAVDLVEALLRLLRRMLRERAEHEVLFDRHIGEDQVALRHVDQAALDELLGLLPHDIRPIETDLARLHADQTADRAQQRRLAVTIRSDEHRALALRHREGDALHDRCGAVSGHHVFELKHCAPPLERP